MFIILKLDQSPRRFGELRRAIPGISQKMLTLTLQGLERDGFVTRTVHATRPVTVEYALSELGQELVLPITNLGSWVLQNIDRIEGARRQFDSTQAV